MSCPEKGFFVPPWPIVALDGKTFNTIFLPAHLSYYIAAILVTLPGTRVLRLALWPVLTFLVYQLGRLDVSEGVASRNAENMGIATWGAVMFFRASLWAFQSTHYTRTGKKRDPARQRTLSEVLWDAGDLCFNLRGVGWDWSPQKLEFVTFNPKMTRWAFVWKSFTDYMFFGSIFELAYQIHMHIDDYPLPLLAKQYIQLMVYPISTYGGLSAQYSIYSIVGVVVFRQGPGEWPPLFGSPWKSTSLGQLWGVHWHQGYRDMMGNTGGVLFQYLFGRLGYVLGTFAISALYHDIGFWIIQRERGMCCSLTPLFMLHGVGVVLEGLFKKVTGKRVDGMVGCLWVVIWSLLAGSTISSHCFDILYTSVEVNWTARSPYVMYVLGRTMTNLAVRS